MKSVLVIGGSGALGKSVVSVFKKTPPPWCVYSLDFSNNTIADTNLLFKKPEDLTDDNFITEITKKIPKLDCIVNVAGGWQGVSLEDRTIIKSLDMMMRQNLYSSVLAAHLAKVNMKEEGLLVLTGANTAKDGYNPGMLSYQLAKQSVHYLTNLLVDSEQLANKTVRTILSNERC
jgi:NAD(P)-dependent dehydrogenase (short-subunit alcohol dehydrogenase family)